MNSIKKIGVLALVLCATFAASAFPHHGGFYGGYHHRHHVGTGFAIGAGILGAGLLASAIYDATHPSYYRSPVVVTPPVVTTPVIQQPVVVQQPVIQQPVIQQPVIQQPVVQAAPRYETRTQNVWVEGRYVDQVNDRGQTVRVWQPGHYEQQQVQVQVP